MTDRLSRWLADDRDGQRVPLVNVGDPEEVAHAEAHLSDVDRPRLEYLRTMLGYLTPTSAVVVVPPTDLIRELFTDAGAQYGDWSGRAFSVMMRRGFLTTAMRTA